MKLNEEIKLSKSELIALIQAEDEKLCSIFSSASDIKELRTNLFNYLNIIERALYNIHRLESANRNHIIIKNTAKQCIRIFKNIIRKENEKLSGFSALFTLQQIFNRDTETIEETGKGFILEMLNLIRGINGKYFMADTRILRSAEITAETRCKILDGYSKKMFKKFKTFSKGTDQESIQSQLRIKVKILKHFSATKEDWNDYKWHLKNVIRDLKTLSSIIKLEQDEIDGLAEAENNSIPFHITPYYLTLFNENGRTKRDRLVRAQVIPSKEYSRNVFDKKNSDIDMDFMGEKSTSPIDCITRRYPNIVILKPFDACPQICVYCQRNWEIKDIKDAHIAPEKVEEAIKWIKENRYITEVLITGGDPLTLDNKYINSLLSKISRIKHVERIRIGSRVLVTLPSRIDDEFIKIIKGYNKPGKKELCITTHFEDTSEITPDVLKAVRKIKLAGINIYNQQVFTYYNSFKYQTCFLRKTLKLSGIDPYYSFNTKGKEETIDFRVPIARIEQERKEEARLLPGLSRTDEPVFNVPKLGKSHLRSWQDHEIIMILKDGSRVYRFYPWESMLLLIDDYLYTDVSIYSYLKRLNDDGENLDDYKTIWHYF